MNHVSVHETAKAVRNAALDNVTNENHYTCGFHAMTCQNAWHEKGQFISSSHSTNFALANIVSSENDYPCFSVLSVMG